MSVAGPEASTKLLLTLERALGRQAGKDNALWKTGRFAAGVVPDLPPATTVEGLVRHWWASAWGQVPPPDHSAMDFGGPGLLVRSVAGQLRSGSRLQARMRAMAGPDPALTGNLGPASALLLLSGAHPLRPLLPDWALQHSTGMLRDATRLKAQGALPSGLDLWAVANPMTDRLDRIQSKAHAGARVLLTQPPLLHTPSEEWMARAVDAGLAEACRVSVCACGGVEHSVYTGTRVTALLKAGVSMLP